MQEKRIMAGLRVKLLLAVLALLGTGSSAHAWWGWRFWGYGPSYYGPAYFGPAYYRYYAPSYTYCPSVLVYPTVRPIPAAPAEPAKKVANSVPTTKEPPSSNVMRKGPTVTESRSSGRDTAELGTSKDRCKVGFWNLTGRDITLRVEGQPRLLAKNRAVTLDLARSFSWQVDQEQASTEHVPAEEPFHEVILRQ
jgi:hypothetical protein